MLKRCFTTVQEFLLFNFYWNIIFSSLSVLFLCPGLHSLYWPLSEFSWKCSVFPRRILRLSNRVLRHKTLKRRWRRQGDWQTWTQSPGGTRRREMRRQAGRSRVCACVYVCVRKLAKIFKPDDHACFSDHQISQEMSICLLEDRWC